MLNKRRGYLFIIFVMGVILYSQPVLASETDGTVNSVNKYAWGEDVGWINFSPTNGNVHITDSGLTGYAWNDLYGWIHLNPTNNAIMNDGEGNLTGYAWSENLGWINFSGVTINSAGRFVGQAVGDNTGTINFDCTNCNVSTDWRPASARTPVVENHGGGYVSGSLTPPSSPAYKFVINNNSVLTDSQAVNIYVYGGSDVNYVWLSENANLILAERIFYNGESVMVVPIVLSSGEGVKTIYGKFCNKNGNCGNILSESIEFAETPFVSSTPLIDSDKATPVIDNIVKTIKDLFINLKLSLPLASLSPNDVLPKVRNFIADLFKDEKKLPDITKLVSRQTPRVMQNNWQLMPRKTVNSFVFAPLPKELAMLENKFPQIKNTFKEVGVERLHDVSKLTDLKLNLPTIKEAISLAGKNNLDDTQIDRGGLLKGLRVGDLTQNLKNKIPSDFVFVSGVNELVNFNVSVALSDRGRPEQTINTISGRTLELVIRPEFPAKSIKGYIVFKQRLQPTASVSMDLASLFGSLVFAEPVFAYDQEQPVEVEERLVLLEFEYTDPDSDGLYTASVQSPVPAGEYEIITVIEFDDPLLGKKEIRMITVVDPEGYVYEKIGDKELRVNGSIISLYWLNPTTKEYELWPAGEYQQENPQITDVRGSYSFLTPPGMYYLGATASGYHDYKSQPFSVVQGGGVHINIGLKIKGWWKAIDWKTSMIIAISMFLMYNFYKDKKWDKN